MKTKFKIPITNASKIALKSFIIVFIFGSLMVFKRTSLEESKEGMKEFVYQMTLSKDDDDDIIKPKNNDFKFDHLKNLKYLMNATCHIAQRDNTAAINALEDDNKILKTRMDNVKGWKDMKWQNKFLNNNDMQSHFIENRLVILVVSNAKNFDLRMAQRNSFNQHFLKSIGMKRMFLLFKPNEDTKGDNIAHQERIVEEHEMYSDIVQGDMQEGYKNLAYKHLMGLRWVSEHCNHFRYILKMDDDIVVDVIRIYQQILRDDSIANKRIDSSMFGYIQMGLPVQRSPGWKWALNRNEQQQDYHPNFLSGWAYVTTPKVAEKLVKASKNIPLLWIDDVWLTGIIASKIGIQLKSLNLFYTFYKEHIECCLSNDLFECEFLVGPSEGDTSVIEKFGQHSQICWKNSLNCKKLKQNESVIKTCHVSNPYFLPENNGIGQVL